MSGFSRRFAAAVDVAAAGVAEVASVFATLLTSGGAALVGWIQAGAGAITRTVQDKLRDQISVLDFMTTAQIADVRAKTGAVDVTAALQAAIDAAGTGGAVYLPPGVYRVVSQLLVNQHRVHLIGAGSWATRIVFAPTVAGTCLKLKLTAAGMLYQGSVRGICFYSDNATVEKTAIEVVDVSGYVLDDVVIGGSVVVGSTTFWGGANSIGVRYRGREVCKSSRFYVAADRPIVISANPNNSIGVDHFHFEDIFLFANANPCVEIDTGVNLTSVTFDGYNPWVLGTCGLQWIDTTATQVSQVLALRGIRTEQGTAPGSFSIRIEHNYGLQGLSIEDCQFDSSREGIKLRKVTGFNLRNALVNQGAGRIALDVDATVKGMTFDEVQWQTGGTANMTGQVMVNGSPKPQSGAALPPSARYQESGLAERHTGTDLANGGYFVALADDAVHIIGGATTVGVLTVIDSDNCVGVFMLRGLYAVALEMLDPSVVFAAADTDTMNCVFWNGTNYVLKNRRGVALNYRVTLTGSYTGMAS